jgi:hypothetical protein
VLPCHPNNVEPPSAAAPHPGEDRVGSLERAVEELRAELAAVRAELAEFRAQFQ